MPWQAVAKAALTLAAPIAIVQAQGGVEAAEG
eukprot:CAMPEP_0202354350 /NCGR_PEP_ID=MMETSP1126-20121109/9708_1 /ASSEMBLY_ACC=CAM_ASM_000457 /TAXON_ID=3047 /ORGANISM="Dunaliella tertiolecta, Strain CCMP1320" /LENGTH=31 /DNA_ID= /DNA_START= /DNA_END= /DNA_ORIENTATION=